MSISFRKFFIFGALVFVGAASPVQAGLFTMFFGNDPQVTQQAVRTTKSQTVTKQTTQQTTHQSTTFNVGYTKQWFVSVVPDIAAAGFTAFQAYKAWQSGGDVAALCNVGKGAVVYLSLLQTHKTLNPAKSWGDKLMVKALVTVGAVAAAGAIVGKVASFMPTLFAK